MSVAHPEQKCPVTPLLSKCFSNAEPTTIIASRDEKRCNASVQWARLVHSRSLRLGDQHRMTVFLRCPRSAASPTCYFTATFRKTANSKTVEISGLGNRLLKTRWFPRWFLWTTKGNHRLTSSGFCLFWTMDHRKRLVLNATTIDGPSALDLANARKSRFFSSFRRITTNELCSAWGSP